jgi:hypothetical protein
VRWDTDAGKQWKMVGAFCPTALDNDLISRCKRTPPPGYHSQNALAGRSSCVPREEPWSCGTCPPSEPDSTVVSRRRLTVPPMGKSSAGEDRLRALVPHAGATPKRSRQLGAVPNALSWRVDLGRPDREPGSNPPAGCRCLSSRHHSLIITSNLRDLNKLIVDYAPSVVNRESQPLYPIDSRCLAVISDT